MLKYLYTLLRRGIFKLKTNSSSKKSIYFFVFLLITCFIVISFSCKDTSPDDFADHPQNPIEKPNDETDDGKIPTTPSNPTTPSTPEFIPSAKSGVMLQGFNWGSAPRTASSHWGKWYKVMIKNADTIGDRFSYVWCPPPSQCDTASSEGYCPTELNVLNNCYGTESELKQMIQAISPAKAIADIVVNQSVDMIIFE